MILTISSSSSSVRAGMLSRPVAIKQLREKWSSYVLKAR